MNNTLQRDTRLDVAKAIAISLVLLWHIQPIRILAKNESNIFVKILGFEITQFNLQVTLVAVPVFILVSLYLFYQKLEDRTLDGMIKRCLRLGEVYLFWTVCQFAFFYGTIFIIFFHKGASNFSVPLPIDRLLMEGGPPLPIVGGSVFYFLFVLLVLVLLSTVFYSFRNIKKLFFFIGISIVVVSILYFEIINLNGYGLAYWRFDNFIIYIPLSYFLLRQEREKLVRYIPFFFIGYIVFSVQDIYLRLQGVVCGAYSRVSIVFGSVVLFSSILLLKNLNKGTIITFLSKYSLGIFATHKFWQLIVILAYQYCGFSVPEYIADFPIDLQALTIGVISISLSFGAVFLGSHSPLKRYII